MSKFSKVALKSLEKLFQKEGITEIIENVDGVSVYGSILKDGEFKVAIENLSLVDGVPSLEFVKAVKGFTNANFKKFTVFTFDAVNDDIQKFKMVNIKGDKVTVLANDVLDGREYGMRETDCDKVIVVSHGVKFKFDKDYYADAVKDLKMTLDDRFGSKVIATKRDKKGRLSILASMENISISEPVKNAYYLDESSEPIKFKSTYEKILDIDVSGATDDDDTPVVDTPVVDTPVTGEVDTPFDDVTPVTGEVDEVATTLVQDMLTHYEAKESEDALYARYIEAVVAGMPQMQSVKIVRVGRGLPVKLTIVKPSVRGRALTHLDIKALCSI